MSVAFGVVLRGCFEVVLSVVLRLFEVCFEGYFDCLSVVLRLFEGCFEVVCRVALRVVLRLF